jgi:hypothetical protein
MVRFLLFLAGLGIIIYYLIKAVAAFFGQIGQPHQPRKNPESEPPPKPKIHPNNIEDAEFEDIPEKPKNSGTIK